jgi:nitroreductase/FMN reductase [NAD(P)H]
MGETPGGICLAAPAMTLIEIDCGENDMADGKTAEELAALLKHRFGEEVKVDPATSGLSVLAAQAAHRSHRAFSDRPVDRDLIRLLCAIALSAPTKSDLQQRDIVIVEDAATRAKIHQLLPDNPWVEKAPVLLVFCGNNRRQRQIHQWRGRPFPNDHLDAFFNAAVDAGIVLGAFTVAAEAAGLGCCAISAIRNHAATVSELLGLPDHVFPVAGLGLGWPASTGYVSLRLPLSVTLHRDRFDESDLNRRIDEYDRRRASVAPYRKQRYVEEYGQAAAYGWSEDKARQYSKPERADFGAFVRTKGFKLD